MNYIVRVVLILLSCNGNWELFHTYIGMENWHEFFFFFFYCFVKLWMWDGYGIYSMGSCTVRTFVYQGTMMDATGQCGSFPCSDVQTHPRCWRSLRSARRLTQVFSSVSLDSTTNAKSNASVSLPTSQQTSKNPMSFELLFAFFFFLCSFSCFPFQKFTFLSVSFSMMPIWKLRYWEWNLLMFVVFSLMNINLNLIWNLFLPNSCSL